MKEEEEWTYKMFDNAVNEEKRWADYLFKDGSMIGLNDKTAAVDVEWIANRRLKSIGLNPVYDILLRTTTSLDRTLDLFQGSSSCTTRNRSRIYVVGGIKQDEKGHI